MQNQSGNRHSRIFLRKNVAPKQATRPLLDQSGEKQIAKGLNQGMRPIVKWVGGKSKLIAAISEVSPTKYRRYFEPFLGGGALFFHNVPESALLSDQNGDLINMYQAVAWNVEAVIRRLADYKRKHSEEHYYALRSRWNNPTTWRSKVARAAAFIYLNKTCYNGLWRVNSKGLFNVPMGRYTAPQIFDSAHLRAASAVLQRAQLIHGDYRDTVNDAGRGDFLYFDPPYHPLTETANFTSYTANSFNEENQRELADLVHCLARRKCHVVVSNSDTPLIHKLYKGLHIFRIRATRNINSKASARGAITEVLVTNRKL